MDKIITCSEDSEDKIITCLQGLVDKIITCSEDLGDKIITFLQGLMDRVITCSEDSEDKMLMCSMDSVGLEMEVEEVCSKCHSLVAAQWAVVVLVNPYHRRLS